VIGILREGIREDLDRHLAASFMSVARQTSPMPPSPSLEMIR
jgi:hypothetical protein